MKKWLYISLGILELFTAIGAIPAGIYMLIYPMGKPDGMQISILANSPFESFLIPGLFLLIFNGIFHLSGSLLTFFRYRRSGLIGVFLGTGLLCWILLQIYWIGLTFFLQQVFIVVSLAEIILGILIWNAGLKNK